MVRDPARDAAASLREVVLPLSFVAHDDARAAAWAFHVLAPRGRLHLLAIADPETLARGHPAIADAIELDEIDESALSGLGQPEMAGLIGAVQRHAAEKDLGCRISIRVGDAVETVTEFANALDNCVLVTVCPRNENAPAYSRAHALIRQSRHPVLVSGKSAEGGD
ncbi:MAG: universal stress protein [Chthoniobacterales bacterium]|nr:universal stress protein [Chthoniobacterales bacterium]